MEQVEDLTAEDEEQVADRPLEAELAEVEAELEEVKMQLEYLMHQQDQLRARREQLSRRLEQERRAPKANWQMEDFPWSAKLKQSLRDVFGLREFRPLQREVMNASLQGRDVLCLLPSGGGKSLCYQLPALVGPGLTLVVSPLLSLIQDQVLSLRALGISGGSLTSLSSKEDVTALYGKLDKGELKLLYVTPEKIVSSKRFMSKLEKVHQAGRLDRIAIDEAHCASQWGNDFRPDYKKLGILKQQFPQVPILALTATATHQVCKDLKTILRIQGCEFFRASVNRPNLFYEVVPKPAAAGEATAAIGAWIKQHYPCGDSGIVYCLTRKDCEAVAAELVAAGVGARHYHADMDPGLREEAHTAWSAGTVQVMVATVAFGMGINKPDVRFVVHHSLSKSLENYYQESGRAGRDGLPARCLMYYRFSDALRQAGIVCLEPTWESNLAAMMGYAAGGAGGSGEGKGLWCRRAIIQRHFAEAPADCRCMCDVCCAASEDSSPAPTDVSQHALALLCILRQQQAKEKKTTLIQLVDLWRGSKDPTVGREAKAMSRDENEAVVAAMMYDGLLQFEFGHTAYATNTYLRASSRGAQLLDASQSGAAKQIKLLLPALLTGSDAANGNGAPSGKAPPLKAARKAPAAHAASTDDSIGGPMRVSLESWRVQRARALQVFPHSILSAEQMTALCKLKPPVDEQALQQVLGVRKHELYGDDLIEVLEGRYVPPPGGGGDAMAGSGSSQPAKTSAGACGTAPGPSQPEVVMLDDSEDDLAGADGDETGCRDDHDGTASGARRSGSKLSTKNDKAKAEQDSEEEDFCGDDDEEHADKKSLPLSKRRRR